MTENKIRRGRGINKTDKIKVSFYHPVTGKKIDSRKYKSFKELSEDLGVSVFSICRYYKNSNGTKNMKIRLLN
jgi:protein tyrosine phosphatase (PTP) superfamily phosphohydrolase (DUF442 family)